MTAIRFADYVFDPRSLRLSARGETLPLRPKTAVILRELLAAGGEIVSKTALLESAWGSRLVADQNLFQAISELRSLLATPDAIITYPNRGYAFALPFEAEAIKAGFLPRILRPSLPWTLAAGLALAVLAGKTFHQRQTDELRAALPASIASFNAGLQRMESEPRSASRLFERALEENPQFLEARLMLADALLRAGEAGEAQAEAQLTYVQAVETGRTSVQIGAMQLFSRLDEVAGHPAAAIDWARSAVEKADESGFVCVAEDAQRRLTDLLARAPVEQNPAGVAPLPEYRSQPQPDARLAQTPPPPRCDPLLGDLAPDSATQTAV